MIQSIFESRTLVDGHIENPVVTLTEVQEHIRDYNSRHSGRKLSDGNPANFIKDFIRNKKSANKNWPQSVFAAGYTCRQLTDENRCFEFVPVPEGQTEPFPQRMIVVPGEQTKRLRVESVSLPTASKQLGRNDEPWLIQVVVRLRIVETHLALFSPLKVVEVDHLQMSVKLHATEIDALFLMKEDTGGGKVDEVIVTCEGKGLRDDILEDQILRQVEAVFKLKSMARDAVLPIALKVVGKSQIHVVEFGKIHRSDISNSPSLAVASECVYEIVPPVPGIGR